LLITNHHGLGREITPKVILAVLPLILLPVLATGMGLAFSAISTFFVPGKMIAAVFRLLTLNIGNWVSNCFNSYWFVPVGSICVHENMVSIEVDFTNMDAFYSIILGLQCSLT
jgi:Na+/H+-translocating membrane pyrophosphatase